MRPSCPRPRGSLDRPDAGARSLLEVGRAKGSDNCGGQNMKPETAGMSSVRLTKLDDIMRRRYVETGHLPSLLIHIWRKGQLVHTCLAGNMDVERERKMREDAI